MTDLTEAKAALNTLRGASFREGRAFNEGADDEARRFAQEAVAAEAAVLTAFEKAYMPLVQELGEALERIAAWDFDIMGDCVADAQKAARVALAHYRESVEAAP